VLYSSTYVCILSKPRHQGAGFSVLGFGAYRPTPVGRVEFHPEHNLKDYRCSRLWRVVPRVFVTSLEVKCQRDYFDPSKCATPPHKTRHPRSA
jgi:hypothetical protein